MPRILSIKQLEGRNARMKDGSPIRSIEPDQPIEEKAPLVEAPKIDVAPIAQAVGALTDAIKDSSAAQVSSIERFLGDRQVVTQPTAWEFEMHRDSKGRVERITAKAIMD